MGENSGATGRRTFLKGVGATGIGLTALSGVAGATKPSGAPRKVVLRSKDAETLTGRAFPTTDESHTGNGSWFTTGDDGDGAAGSDKLQFYLTPDAKPFNVGSFTIGDIRSLTYHTKKVGAPVDGSNAPNIYVSIYTEPDGTDDDGSWYGRRLTLEPYFSRNLDAPGDEWVQWSTDDGTNQLTVFDNFRSGVGYGFYGGQPTLSELTDGTFNWSDVKSGAEDREIDYASETVKYIVFDTGSGWADDYEGYLDSIELVVDSGRGESGKPTALRIELEA